MAPEIASHHPYNVSADVYSWAMVSYEVFVLEKPFHGWTRDMHSDLVCGRGARPDVTSLSGSISSMLEICWHQSAYRRPAMRAVELQMKMLEERQLIIVCGERTANEVSVELPRDFNFMKRKLPNRNYSESPTATTISTSHESLGSYMYP
jgi:Protein tyrosine and serine/threonine kinase